MLLKTVFARVDEKILSHFFTLQMSLLIKLACQFHFVMENLSCEFSLVNRSSKISGKLVSGPLLAHVLGLFCCLTK